MSDTISRQSGSEQPDSSAGVENDEPQRPSQEESLGSEDSDSDDTKDNVSRYAEIYCLLAVVAKILRSSLVMWS